MSINPKLLLAVATPRPPINPHVSVSPPLWSAPPLQQQRHDLPRLLVSKLNLLLHFTYSGTFYCFQIVFLFLLCTLFVIHSYHPFFLSLVNRIWRSSVSGGLDAFVYIRCARFILHVLFSPRLVPVFSPNNLHYFTSTISLWSELCMVLCIAELTFKFDFKNWNYFIRTLNYYLFNIHLTNYLSLHQK